MMIPESDVQAKVAHSLLFEVDVEGTISATEMRKQAAVRFKRVVRGLALVGIPLVAPSPANDILFERIIQIAEKGEEGAKTQRNTKKAIEYCVHILYTAYHQPENAHRLYAMAAIHLEEQYPLLEFEHYHIP